MNTTTRRRPPLACTCRPQAIAQALNFVRLDPSERTWLMLLSLMGSLLSVSFLMVTVEASIELSMHNLTNNARVTGYLPTADTRRKIIVLLGIFFFSVGYLGAYLVTMSVATSLTIWFPAALFIGEVGVFFTLRAAVEELK